ncbi:MAG TPA: phosphoribosylglycinamide formyltransferase [Chitinophagaceae bacterium]
MTDQKTTLLTHRHDQPRIAIFASGAGTNAKNLIAYFKTHRSADVSLVVTNKKDAGVLKIAEDANVPSLIVEKERFFRTAGYVQQLQHLRIDFIVLAGFLWKMPEAFILAWPRRIVNIHPALLPKYGGKGMYGGHVHSAVLDADDKTSGITIHYVDEHYDNGDVIFTAECPVLPGDTPETLAQRIHQLEYEHYPRVVEQLVTAIRRGSNGQPL